MSQHETLTALLRHAEDGALWLAAPHVGILDAALDEGRFVRSGDVVGFLTVLGLRYALVAPEGVSGFVEAASARGHRAVEYGERLAQLVSADAHRGGAGAGGGASASAKSANAAVRAAASAGFVARAPLGGTFYRAMSPGTPPLVAVGMEVTKSSPLCIIEAMKVMNRLVLGDLAGAPARGRVLEICLADASSVATGDRLFVIGDA